MLPPLIALTLTSTFQIRDYEYVKRTIVSDLGVKSTERISLKADKKSSATEEDEFECQTCSANLYVSFVSCSFYS